MWRRALADPAAADRIIGTFRGLPKRLYPVESAMVTAWALRDSFSIADALYVTIAGALGAPLVTTDGRLARAAGTGPAGRSRLACPGFDGSVSRC